MRGKGAFTSSSFDVSRSSALQLALPLLEHARDDRHDQPFREIDHVVERRVRHFGLDHPELGEVAARLRFLRAEHRAEVVDAAERHGVGLGVQLSALRQEDFLVFEIVDREERCRAFARGRRENGRVGEDEPLIVEEIAHRADDLVAHAKNRGLLFRSNPEMPAIEQVVDAVFLRRDRIVDRRAHDLEVRDVELVTARRAAVGAHRAVHDDRGLLREMVGLLELLVADGGLRDDGLDEAAAVAHRQEMDLSARAAVVKPAADRDRLALALRDLIDVGNHISSCSLVPTLSTG